MSTLSFHSSVSSKGNQSLWSSVEFSTITRSCIGRIKDALWILVFPFKIGRVISQNLLDRIQRYFI